MELTASTACKVKLFVDSFQGTGLCIMRVGKYIAELGEGFESCWYYRPSHELTISRKSSGQRTARA